MDLSVLGRNVANLVFEASSQASAHGVVLDYSKLGAEVARLANNANAQVAPDHGRRTFDFEKLPPEIRNQIYGLTLTADATIEITRHTPKSQFADALTRTWERDSEAGIGRPKPHSFLEVKMISPENPSSHNPTFGRHHTVGLLAVNKATCAEARPVLYGSNTFLFASAAAFKLFAKEFGKNCALLRDVEIKRYVLGQQNNGMLKHLQPAADFRRLHLDVRTLGYYQGESSVIRTWEAIKAFVYGPLPTRCECGDDEGECSCAKRVSRRRSETITFSDLLRSSGRNGSYVGPAEFKEHIRAKWYAREASHNVGPLVG